jgi:hypothetical protein
MKSTRQKPSVRAKAPHRVVCDEAPGGSKGGDAAFIRNVAIITIS